MLTFIPWASWCCVTGTEHPWKSVEKSRDLPGLTVTEISAHEITWLCGFWAESEAENDTEVLVQESCLNNDGQEADREQKGQGSSNSL